MEKFILFELNEVPWKVIHHYIKMNPSSTLAKILPISQKFKTYTQDEGHLHPWVTWPTFHRGVNNKAHNLKDFGETLTEVDKKFPPIWKILNEHKIKCGIFASMHSFPMPEDLTNYSFYVPDPFASDSNCHPKKIIPFQEFNLTMSRKSGRNVDTSLGMGKAINVMKALPSLGIKINTLGTVVNHIIKERINPALATRRRTYQSVLAFDIFMKLLKNTKPGFVTYFSNHVASAMHRYWAATFPEDYQEFKIEKKWVDTYKNEIDFAMGEFDKFLRKIVKFIDNNPEYKLIVASSMGQASTKAETMKSEVSMKNIDLFMKNLGLNEQDWTLKPAMHPQYNVVVEKDKIDHFRNSLTHLFIDNKELTFREKNEGFFSIDLGHPNLEEERLTFNGEIASFQDFGLENITIDDESGGTAYHIPEGSMFIYDPRDKSEKKGIKEIKTTSVVPAILKKINIQIPAYMTDREEVFV